MAMKIRLARGGSKKRPFYRIVAADSRMPRDGRFIEKLGTYNPLLPKDSEERVKMDMERVQYWIGQGAQPTDRVRRMLEAAGVLPKTERNNPNKGTPGKKAQERVQEKADKAAAAAEAANAPAEEAPAEEAAAAAQKLQPSKQNVPGMDEFSDDFRAGLHDLMRWRRDVRHFRTDPVDEALLRQCLDTFSLAPSVGLSEPWRIIRVTSDAARTAAMRISNRQMPRPCRLFRRQGRAICLAQTVGHGRRA